jgi:adenosine deaminase/aminodeoxyfutalosine deaminase
MIRDFPKAELHLHLEGSMEPTTLHELAPELTDSEIATKYSYSDFTGFLQSYVWATAFLKTPEDYGLITARLLEQLAAENVIYAEINISVGVMSWKGIDVAAAFDAISSAAQRQNSVEVRWIFDAVRQWGAEKAAAVAELAAARIDRGVVGFGIGGDEARGPAEWFGEVFRYARSRGLRLAPHAGETTGPETIWKSLEIGAERIGHGIRAVDDPVLANYLRDRQVPLEVCISSNVCTGVVPSLESHPVRRLYDAGIPITLNTDDPAMFHTTLSREYALAAVKFGLPFRTVAENSFRFRFDPHHPGVSTSTKNS